MVRLVEKCFNEISAEIDTWRDILAVPYRAYLQLDSLSSGN